jgi:cyclase
VAIGSMAVFQGKDLGVLIKFPSRKDQDAIFEQD